MTGGRWAAPALAALTIGCGGGGDDGGSGAGRSDGIAVVDAWARPSPATVTDAAVYVSMANAGGVDDEIVAMASERCVSVIPHVTSFDDDGVASMNDVGDALSLPAGDAIEMEPNGLHLMCLGIDAPFVVGETFPIDIEFSRQGLVSAPVVVEDR